MHTPATASARRLEGAGHVGRKDNKEGSVAGAQRARGRKVGGLGKVVCAGGGKTG